MFCYCRAFELIHTKINNLVKSHVPDSFVLQSVINISSKILILIFESSVSDTVYSVSESTVSVLLEWHAGPVQQHNAIIQKTQQSPPSKGF